MLDLFHDTHAASLAAFREAADEAGFTRSTLDHGTTGPDGEPLGIELAVKSHGPIRRAVVVSSGTHGVEGYFGAAVQLHLLRTAFRTQALEEGDALVMIHGVNPWGFAHRRRYDQDGVDCNRNFRSREEGWSGAPEGYLRMKGLLNPDTPPGGFDPWLLKAGVEIAKHGFSSLKDAIASGQYEVPGGLFYGGAKPSPTYLALEEALPPLLGDCERVLHLDLHTGSGPWKTYVLAFDLADADRVARLKTEFGDVVEAFDPSGVLYQIHGALGPWLQSLMPDVVYDCFLAEFGTYHNIKVLAELRWENRAVKHGTPAQREEGAAKMMEVFCPADATWRKECVAMATEVAKQATTCVLKAGGRLG